MLTRQVSGLWAWVQCRMFHSRWVMDGCYLGQRGSLFGQSYQRQAKHVKSCSAVVVRPFLFACRDVDVDLQDCHVQVCADVLQCVRIPMDRLTRRLSWIVFPVQNNAANRFYLLSLDSLAWACFDVWKIWYVHNLSHSGVCYAGCVSKLPIQVICWPPVLRNLNVFGWKTKRGSF